MTRNGLARELLRYKTLSAMSITAEQERAYYDRAYSALLSAPESHVGMRAETYFKMLDNPALPYYERRRLFRRTLERAMAKPLAGKKVLDYGCGVGEWGVTLSLHGAQVTLLDLSPVAIEVCERRARASASSSPRFRMRLSIRAQEACCYSCY